MSSESLVNTTVADKYLLIREVGSGGMATVYEAEHIEIGKRVAIKVLHQQVAATRSMVERFLREARAAASIESPHICQVHDVGRLHDGRPFLVMELLHGESLFERLRRVRQLDPDELIPIIGQVCRGLARAHDVGVLHRDLKPENIFLAITQEGEQRAKIVDFGLAGFYASKALPANQRLTRDGALFGTPLYMCPEQVDGAMDLDPRSDLWSLACIVFESLVGRTVWNEEEGLAAVLAAIVTGPAPVPSELRPDLPQSFDAWFQKAMAIAPADRFADARTFATQLGQALAIDARPWLGTTGSIDRPAQFVVRSSPAATPTQSMSMDPGEAPTQRPPSMGTLTSIERVLPRRETSYRVPVIATIIGLCGGVAAIVYGAGLVSARDTGTTAVSQRAATGDRVEAPSPRVSRAIEAMDESPCEKAMSRGRAAIARGQFGEAASHFEDAWKRDHCGAAQGMLRHAQVTVANRGNCKVTGLGRPRSLERSEAARHASVLPYGDGVLVVWIEGTGDDQRLVGAMLGEALAPGASFEIARGGSFSGVDVQEQGRAFVIAYATETTGLHAIRAEADGRLAGEPVRIVAATGSTGSIVAAKPWVAVYPGPAAGSSHNLFAMVLDDALEPTGEAATLTAYTGTYGPVGPRVSGPVSQVVGGHLVVAYRVERGSDHDIIVQILPTARPSGGATPASDVLGVAHRLTRTNWRVFEPSMGCSGEACFVTWRGRPRGATLVGIQVETGRELVRTVVSPRSENVSVRANGLGEAAVGWYEEGKLWFALVERGGLGEKAMVARAEGEQERPVIRWTGSDWIVAWTTFEQGHPEPYVARIRCGD